MAYKCTFMDNEVYSAGDVNAAFSRLISGGVITYTNTNGTLTGLNDAISEFTSGGVTANVDSCRVVKDGDSYKISDGECIMNDGSMIIFSGGGEVIPAEGNMPCMVYLKRNAAANTIEIKLGKTAESDADCIPLAELDAAGAITDRRVYAQSRVMPSGQNVSVSARLKTKLGLRQSIEVEMGFSGFRYIVYDMYSSGAENEACDLIDGEEHYIRNGNWRDQDYDGTVRKEGSKLIFKSYSSSLNYDLRFKVI